MYEEAEVLVAVISCPECGTEFEGTWKAPGDYEEEVEEDIQNCPEAGHSFVAGFPGYSFKTEAG